MVRIACLSDLHGHLPEVPDCDLLLLGGDYRPGSMLYNEHRWILTKFCPWIDRLSERMDIIGVAGNHDFLFQEEEHDLPEANWTYLRDSGTEWNGLKIWGSPWQPWFHDWAFNATEPELKEKWALIPDDTDILLLHGPPNGYGDFVEQDGVHTGSPSLLERILEIKPKLAVAGHIHSGYGQYTIGDTIFVNASLVNEKRHPVHDIIVVEL